MSKRFEHHRSPHKARPSSAHTPSTQSRKIRVMIVEDSLTIREFLTHIINDDSRFEVVAAVESGEEALQLLTPDTGGSRRLRHVPDVITMDIRLPGMNGLEATRRIMSELPTPIVVVAASVEADDLKISMNALHAGALAVLEKPVGVTHEDYRVLTDKLRTQLAIMSQVKVVRQRMRTTRTSLAPSPSPFPRLQRSGFKMLGLVASTGGPNALLEVLNRLPVPFPVPILIVQHMTASFMKAFIAWLNENTSLEVLEAYTGQLPKPGCAYVAPAGYHLYLRSDRLVLDDGPLVCMQRPSGTILLQSMAEELGCSALGVLLTGMGEDGAEGLTAIRLAGGFTITEHESTAIVYGMPAAAVALGGSCESLPLPDIGSRIAELMACPVPSASRTDDRPVKEAVVNGPRS